MPLTRIVLGVTTRAVDDRRRRGLHRSLGAANFDLAIGAAPSAGHHHVDLAAAAAGAHEPAPSSRARSSEDHSGWRARRDRARPDAGNPSTRTMSRTPAAA